LESITEKVCREQAIQTVSPKSELFALQKPHDHLLGGALEPEKTRLSHVLSVAGQIHSPIAAVAAFIDNSVQEFHSQIVN